MLILSGSTQNRHESTNVSRNSKYDISVGVVLILADSRFSQSFREGAQKWWGRRVVLRTSEIRRVFWGADDVDRPAIWQVYGHSCGDCSEGEDELLLHSTATGVTTGRFQSFFTRLWSQSLGLYCGLFETTRCSSSCCPCVSDLCAKSLRPVTAQWAGQSRYNSWRKVGQFGSINNATGSFTGFSQFLQASAGIVPQFGHDLFSFHILSNPLFTDTPITRYCLVSDIATVIK